MSESTDRAWLFDLPVNAVATDPGDRPGGLRLTPTGALAMTDTARAVQQSILLLLATRPGERLMRPDYGCHLHRLVFAPNDASTAGLAIHYIRSALQRWEPRAAIQRLDAGANLLGRGDEAVLDILLEYRIRHTGEERRLTLGYDLASARLAPFPGVTSSRQGDVEA